MNLLHTKQKIILKDFFKYQNKDAVVLTVTSPITLNECTIRKRRKVFLFTINEVQNLRI